MEIHDKDGKRINPATQETFSQIADRLAAAATEQTLQWLRESQTNGSQLSQIINPDGNVVRLQVSNFGILDISESDFSFENDRPFLLKNDNNASIALEVMPAGGDQYVETVFGVGWNPEVIISVKAKALGGSLLWGY